MSVNAECIEIEKMPKELRRLLVILAVDELGVTREKAGRMYKISKNTYKTYKIPFSSFGFEALRDKSRSRTGGKVSQESIVYRKPLSEEAKRIIAEIVIDGKYQSGSYGNFHNKFSARNQGLRLANICSVLNSQLDSTYHTSTVSRYLKKSGLKECCTEFQSIFKDYDIRFEKIEKDIRKIALYTERIKVERQLNNELEQDIQVNLRDWYNKWLPKLKVIAENL